MTVVVQLEDGEGRVVTNSYVMQSLWLCSLLLSGLIASLSLNSDLPLKAVLVYDTADVPEVKTQHILKFIQVCICALRSDLRGSLTVNTHVLLS